MIDRYLLRYFLAVVDQGNFTKAAAQAHVSQPTLSAGIAKLERTLGKPLFLRTNRRVELTEAGARFAVHARRIESEFGAAERAVQGAPSFSTFRLGVLTTIPSDWLCAALAELSGGERVELLEGRERDLLDALGRRRIDAALTVVRRDSDRFAGEVLHSEGYKLAMSAKHPLAGADAIAAETLADNPMIVRRHCEALSETSRHFTSRGVRPSFSARTVNDERTLALVRAGLGVTVMPAGYSAEGVARPKLAGFALMRDVGVLSSPDDATIGAAAPVAALRRVFAALS